jgi:hypothetical protein
MPKFLENILQQAAASKGLKGDAADKYTFGALNNIGAMQGNKETAKGRLMTKKHNAKLSAAQAARIRRKVNTIIPGASGGPDAA